jgi:tol-pal system protein YbgF
MKKTFIFSLIALLPWVILPIKKDTKMVLDKLDVVEALTRQLEQKVSIMSAEFSGLLKTVTVMEDKITAITRNSADLSQNKDNLALNIQYIKEEMDELKKALKRINDQLIGIPGTAENSSTQDQSGDQNQAIPVQSAETIYYTAYSDYIKKNYSLAIEGFRQFIKHFPENDLTENALYWIGECYYTQRMYQDAINAFSELIASSKKGDKIPDANLKKGFALIEMGKQDQGVSVLKQLISQYPLSDEAKLAQQKIKEVSE